MNYYQIIQTQPINNPTQNVPNLNNLLGNTVNNTILMQEQNINPNQILQVNNTDNLSKIKNINNSNYANNIVQNNKIKEIKNSKTKIIEKNKYKLSSSGKLLTSSRSSKFNKVLKNGIKIKNIDINSDCEDMKNEDTDSVSTNYNNKKDSNSKKLISKFSSNANDLKKTFKNERNQTNNINKTDIQFNENQLIQSVKQSLSPKNKSPKQTVKSITPGQQENDGSFSINKSKTQFNIQPIDKLNSKLNLNQNRQTKNIDNNIDNKTLNKNNSNSSDLNEKSLSKKINIQNNNLSSKEALSNPKLNTNQNEKNTLAPKKEDDNISKKSESNKSSKQYLIQNIPSNNSNINNVNKQININDNNNINNYNINNLSDNYLITHLDEYVQNEASPLPLNKKDNLNSISYTGFRLCSELTKPGKNENGNTKIDQDTPLISLSVGGIIGFNLFGVLDGHGVHGHFVSQFCKEYFIKKMEEYIELLKNYSGNLTAEQIYNELKNDHYNYIIELYNKSDTEIATKANFDYMMSGTTCNIVFQFNNHLVCFSVGDSRGILIYDKGDSKNEGIFPLSTDHKPNLPNECQRIKLYGGEVEQVEDMFGNKLGPARVFKAGFDYPGLAMSRSLGDLEAKECGVISTPQIMEYDINYNSKYMVICSDGVWEFITNEQVRDIGNYFYKNNDIAGFCTELIKFSEGLWEEKEIIRDDITVVSVFF